jgi:hypothetical protein
MGLPPGIYRDNSKVPFRVDASGKVWPIFPRGEPRPFPAPHNVAYYVGRGHLMYEEYIIEEEPV